MTSKFCSRYRKKGQESMPYRFFYI